MDAQLARHIQEYNTFKHGVPVASSQMLRIMAKVEIEMMTKDVMAVLNKKYHVDILPEPSVVENILNRTFENSIIRSDNELRSFLEKTMYDYENMSREELIQVVNQEFEDLTTTVKNIYNTSTTSSYADFPRRCTEEITKVLRELNQTEEFEQTAIKMKMQLKKELTKVLQKFLDGAYKTIHTQILMNMKSQIDRFGSI